VNNPLQNPDLFPTVNLFVDTEATFLFAAPRVDLGAFSLDGQAALEQHGDRVLVTRTLNFGKLGRLDLVDNSLIHDYPNNVPPAGPPARGLIISAYQPTAAAHWGGPGIYSSLAAADPSKAVGYAESAELFGRAGGTFHEVKVDSSATLVTYTLFGDADLDRSVNFADLARLAQNYNQTAGTEWITGDFSYDLATTFADLVKLAQNYNQDLILA
jgi:hypothetical protein